MSTKPVLEYPDPRLRECSSLVTDFDESVRDLVDTMLETLYSTSAIGLSAPQIDDRRAVLVMDLSEDRSAPQVFVNPEIHAKKAWGFVEESCLSVPGVVGNVLRATQVRMRACDANGAVFERELEGMAAVCLQHEMDHLEGRLFIDRLSIFRRLRIRARARASARTAPAASEKASILQ